MILMTRVANTLCWPLCKGLYVYINSSLLLSPFLSAPQKHLLTSASLSRPERGGTLRIVSGVEIHNRQEVYGLGLSSFKSMLSAKF